jgi:hypothetical protein
VARHALAMNQVGIATPVAAGRAPELTALLSALPRDRPPTRDGPAGTRPSPFTGVLPATHFARLVVIELANVPHLFFTSCFDGDTRTYLRALAATPTAQSIWSHCQPTASAATLTPSDLERYLCDERNWLPAHYVVSAVPPRVTVSQINRALSVRAQLSALVTRAASLDPASLAHDFRQLPAIQALLRGS